MLKHIAVTCVTMIGQDCKKWEEPFISPFHQQTLIKIQSALRDTAPLFATPTPLLLFCWWKQRRGALGSAVKIKSKKSNAVNILLSYRHVHWCQRGKTVFVFCNFFVVVLSKTDVALSPVKDFSSKVWIFIGEKNQGGEFTPVPPTNPAPPPTKYDDNIWFVTKMNHHPQWIDH